MDSTENSLTDSFKSQKILHLKGNPSPSGKDLRLHQESNPWSLKTPEKPVDLPRSMKLLKSDPGPSEKPDPLLAEQIPFSPVTRPKRRESSISLPEKYEMLDKLFHSFDNSIRLCRMKGSMATFTNVRPKIECLTDRRFTYSHLAQIKFILPEAIEIKKILVHDVRTSFMKPELLLTLDVKAVEDSENPQLESGNILLREIFRSRLVDYFKAHPQDDDEIPEDDLPEPFNALKKANQTNTETILESSTSTETPQTAQEEIVVSGMLSRVSGPSFTQLNPQTQCPLPETAFPAPKKLTPLATPVKHTNSETMANHSVATPVQSDDSTPAKLASATPRLAPPKRCDMTPDNDDATKSVNKLVRRPLKFDNTTEKIQQLEDDAEEKGCLSVLPESLIRSIQEKETKALMEKDAAISQAKRRKQMIAGLPKLFDMIYSLFQSIKRSVVTKEKLLLSVVVSSNLDILDTKEAKEQLRLLQELAPEWIYERMGYSGDCFLCVNKISSPDGIRARIAEAI